jgi:hypothetical protein
MIFKKPNGLKYTDMCIFIDQNIPNIINPGEHPEIEDKVYNYLWLLVKALAIKKCMFNNFQDYDPFAFYAASRLFFALRKNYWNQGKVIKGKQIRPIKSCLNYTKALLYPMKIEYQNETFKEIITEEFVSKKFDALAFKESLRAQARDTQGVNVQFRAYVQDTFSDIGSVIDKVLRRSPFTVNSLEYKRLRISLMLNALNSIRMKNKLNSELPTIILWKLPKSMQSYVKVLLKEFYTEIKLEIMECHRITHIDDELIDKLLQPPKEDIESYEDQY